MNFFVLIWLTISTAGASCPKVLVHLYEKGDAWFHTRFEGTADISYSLPDGSVHTENFDITRRSLTDFLKVSEHDGLVDPKPFFNIEELKGHMVLDAGAGSGDLVRDFRNAGIDAYGIDMVATPSNRVLSPFFVQGDVSHLPFKNGLFDFIYSNNSIFSYYSFSGPMRFLLIQTLNEFKRTGTKKCVFRFYDVWDLKETKQEVEAMGFVVTAMAPFKNGPDRFSHRGLIEFRVR